jgi:hypothetical protein
VRTFFELAPGKLQHCSFAAVRSMARSTTAHVRFGLGGGAADALAPLSQSAGSLLSCTALCGRPLEGAPAERPDSNHSRWKSEFCVYDAMSPSSGQPAAARQLHARNRVCSSIGFRDATVKRK